MAALGGKIPRHGTAVRHSFTDAVRAVGKRISRLMPRRRGSEDAALAIVATMVGALTLARAVDDPGFFGSHPGRGAGTFAVALAARRVVTRYLNDTWSTTHDRIRKSQILRIPVASLWVSHEVAVIDMQSHRQLAERVGDRVNYVAPEHRDIPMPERLGACPSTRPFASSGRRRQKMLSSPPPHVPTMAR